MSLSLNIRVQNDKEAMILVDETGDYDVVSNDTGWGAPNSLRADLSDSDVVVTPPGATALASFDLGAFMTSASELSKDITTDLDGLDTSLSDGIWKFVFTLAGITQTSYTLYALRLNTIQARVQSLALNNLDIVDFREADSMLRKIEYAFEAEEYVLAEELIEELNDLLEDCNTDLGGCGC